ncbi:hypothetical protein Anapl_13864 [Anas platyrhynchos]|uniref:Uncharacterized protein n=1 Tax=Anas platyrhynchos TaxID=8839 RepID=R0K5C0_ANAPL|nr:hypothetical protein Anapl_13864 [Anas platyrhynchos]
MPPPQGCLSNIQHPRPCTSRRVALLYTHRKAVQNHEHYELCSAGDPKQGWNLSQSTDLTERGLCKRSDKPSVLRRPHPAFLQLCARFTCTPVTVLSCFWRSRDKKNQQARTRCLSSATGSNCPGVLAQAGHTTSCSGASSGQEKHGEDFPTASIIFIPGPRCPAFSEHSSSSTNFQSALPRRWKNAGKRQQVHAGLKQQKEECWRTFPGQCSIVSQGEVGQRCKAFCSAVLLTCLGPEVSQESSAGSAPGSFRGHRFLQVIVQASPTESALLILCKTTRCGIAVTGQPRRSHLTDPPAWINSRRCLKPVSSKKRCEYYKKEKLRPSTSKSTVNHMHQHASDRLTVDVGTPFGCPLNMRSLL